MKKYFVVFSLFLFFTSLLHSENVLDTLWQIKGEHPSILGDFVGFAQNPIDSSLLVSYINSDDHNNAKYYLAHINSKTGEISQKKSVNEMYSRIFFLNDTNELFVSTSLYSLQGSENIKIINKNNLDTLFTYKSFSLNYMNQLNRAITTLDSKIVIFDTKEKKVVKEYNTSNFFDKPNVHFSKVVISNYNNYLIYNSSTQLSPSPPYPNITELVVLDSNGKVVYKDKNDLNLGNGSPQGILAISKDQKLIAYMTSENKNTIKILDLTTLTVIKSVSTNNLRPLLLRFSPDDKLLFLGSESGLMYFDLENWKRKWITDDGVIDNFNFDLFNPNIIYINLGGLFQAFKINSLTSVINENPVNNTFVANYQANTHSLNLNMNLVNNGNLMVTLFNISGSPLMVLENSLFQLGENNKTYNINNFPQGAYYLQIKLNNEIIYPALNFIKVN